MSEELQQNLKDFSYEGIAPSNPVPPMQHNQAALPRDCAIPPSSDIHHPDNTFPLPATYPAYREPCRPAYPQYYGSLTTNETAAHINRVSCPTHPAKQINNNAPHLRGPAPGTAYGQPSLDFNNTSYNPAVPGMLMANIYRDLSVRFINSPQSNIVMIRMESLPNGAGRSKVTIELEIVD